LLFHPHIHCVVPAGGLAPDRTRWIRGSDRFFLPLDVLKVVFRGKFVEGLKDAVAQQRLCLAGPIQHLNRPNCFAAFVRKLHRHKWVVYVKPPFGGPAQVLRYLGRYTHRVAISNHRLLAFDGDTVTFRWRDYAHGNIQRTMTVSAEEFIRRFLMHVLPKSFVRIRHFGFMANYQRSTSFELCRLLLGMAPTLPAPETASPTSAWLCPACQTPLTLVEKLTAAQIAWRLTSKCYVDTS
jgi:Putative transposase